MASDELEIERERRLDALLDTVDSPEAGAALRARVMATIPPGRPSLVRRHPWWSGLGLAGAATFGAAPIFVAAPFFLVWFGVVPTAQVMMVSFYTALLLYIFSRRAADNVAREYVESASTLGAGRFDVFRAIYLPGTVPELVGGFRIALAGAWGLEAIAELLGAQSGIGFLINYFSEVFGIVEMVSLTLLLGCVAIVCDGLAVLSARALLRWTATGKVA